ncbi:hypothetical protein TNCV_4042911 [Trichonephila clavipes]|nr:hypothetical protein TNCV_4042911 [Trichonephila clavipes]
MVWGGISIGGRTDLHIIQNGTLTGRRYADEILDLMSSLTLEPLEIPLFSRMIMPDRIELIWWRTCLKLKHTSYGIASVLSDLNQSSMFGTCSDDALLRDQRPPATVRDLEIALLESGTVFPKV